MVARNRKPAHELYAGVPHSIKRGAKLCPICGGGRTITLDSRPFVVRNIVPATRRRYACATCEHRWATIEVSEDAMVIGQDGLTGGNADAIVNVLRLVNFSTGEVLAKMTMKGGEDGGAGA